MYSFQFDIGSFSAPVAGDGYVTGNPYFENTKINKIRDNDKIYSRLEFSGGLKFAGDEYDAMVTLRGAGNFTIGIKSFWKSSEIFEGKVVLRSNTYNEDAKECILSVDKFDRYNEILSNSDIESNVLGSATGPISTAKTTIISIPHILYQVVTPEPVVLPSGYASCGPGDPPAWDSTVNYVPAVDVQPPDGLYQGDYTSFALEGGVKYRCKVLNTNIQPPNATYWATVTTLRIFKQQRTDYRIAGFIWDDTLKLYYKADCSTNTVTISFNRCRVLFDLLELLVTGADSSINIAETGVNEYSNYLNSDIELATLMISDKSDIKRYDSSNSALYENITLNNLLGIYKKMFNLDWLIDDSNYFKFYHPTETGQSIGTNPELNNLGSTGKNWTLGKNQYSYLNDRQWKKETWSFEQTDDEDFSGLPIIYDNEFEISEEHNLRDINCDVKAVMRNDNEVSDSGFVILATELTVGDYIIVNKTGILSEETLVNGKLATSQIINDHHITGDRPFDKGNVNGVADVSLTKRRDREQTIIPVPIRDPDEIDFDELVATDLDNLEARELSISLDTAKAEFKGVF